MKHIYFKTLFSIVIAQTSFIPMALGQSGTESQPMSVAEGLKKTDQSSTNYWVTGYIVGEIEAYSNSKYFYEMAPPFNGNIALLIADSPKEHDLQNCMTIQFPGSTLADDFCLDTNGQYWRKKINVEGLLRNYFNVPGITKIKNYRFEDFTPENDESVFWNFLESFDNKSYIPASSSSVFAGGIYTGNHGEWLLKGATMGDTSNDNKWDRSSIRLRLTEGATGEKGYLELMTEKADGIGEIRFWAGNYKEDSGKLTAVSVYYTLDNGATWTTAANNLTIKRGNAVTTNGMSEYKLEINQSGNVRIRIAKADDTTAGINIDKIRLSDYVIANNIQTAIESDFSARSFGRGILISASEGSLVEVFEISGRKLHGQTTTYEPMFIPMHKGIYLIRCQQQTVRVMVHE